jgi:hypothetical protein
MRDLALFLDAERGKQDWAASPGGNTGSTTSGRVSGAHTRLTKNKPRANQD